MTPLRFTPQTRTIWLSVLLLLVAHSAAADERPSAPVDVKKVQGLVNGLRKGLVIRQPVTVSIVATNPLMASVEPVKGRNDAFILCLERGFVDQLSEPELRAVLAHELGHVWTFTHFPYLQTEALANQVAMRLVSRDMLEKVYEKVWQHGGTKGEVARFMGPPPPRDTEPVRGLAPR